MTSDDFSNFDHLSLHGQLRRDLALGQLLAPDMGQGEDVVLYFAADHVTLVDVVAATASSLRMARHLRLHPKGRIEIWRPKNQQIAARYLDMLDPLPDHVSVRESPTAKPPAHFTLLPATPIVDSESARLAGECVFDACADARISRRRAGYITAAVMELADNAVIHASGGEDPAFVAVSNFGRERTVEVAVTDCGEGISESGDEVKILRAIPGSAIRGERGFLAEILRRGHQAGVEVEVEMMAGRGRLRWSRTAHVAKKSGYVPGMTVVLRVGA